MRDTCADTTRTREALGFVPQTRLCRGPGRGVRVDAGVPAHGGRADRGAGRVDHGRARRRPVGVRRAAASATRRSTASGQSGSSSRNGSVLQRNSDAASNRSTRRPGRRPARVGGEELLARVLGAVRRQVGEEVPDVCEQRAPLHAVEVDQGHARCGDEHLVVVEAAVDRAARATSTAARSAISRSARRSTRAPLLGSRATDRVGRRAQVGDLALEPWRRQLGKAERREVASTPRRPAPSRRRSERFPAAP